MSVLLLYGGITPSSGNAKSAIHIDMITLNQACKGGGGNLFPVQAMEA